MQDFLLKALKTLQNNQPCACVTVIEATAAGTPRKPGAKMLVFPDGSQFGTIGGGLIEKESIKQALRVIKTRKTAIVGHILQKSSNALCGGCLKVFIEPFLPKKRLIICGAGHIGLALSFLGKLLNLELIIIDNRKKLANKQRFGHADKIFCMPYKTCLSHVRIGPQDMAVIVTQGHDTDFACLKALIKTNADYVGVISSQSKKIEFLRKLKGLKLPEKSFEKLRMPTGLDIGAQTPEEIAVSIMAQIIAHLNKDCLGAKKFKKSKIKKIKDERNVP